MSTQEAYQKYYECVRIQTKSFNHCMFKSSFADQRNTCIKTRQAYVDICKCELEEALYKLANYIH